MKVTNNNSDRGADRHERRLSQVLHLLVGGFVLSTAPVIAHCEELQNFIKDLYGGNGIFLGVDPGAFQHSAHFASDSLTKLTNLNQQVATNVNLSSVTPSTPNFTFDILQGMPSDTESSLGPVFAERAETIGRGNFNFSLSFTHVNYTELNGQNLNDIPILLNHGPVGAPCLTPTSAPFCTFLEDKVLLNINLDIQRNVFAAYGTYGITDRWDVSIVVPVVDQTAKASSVATILDFSHTDVHHFDAAHPAFSSTGGEATGFGDIIVRTKYNILRDAGAAPDVSIIGQVNLPSGNSADLLGSGSTDVLGGVVVSKQLGRFSPHLNLAYQVASGGYDRNNIQYAAGADYSVTPNVTVAGDFLGRQYVAAGSEFNETDFSIGVKWRPIGRNVLVADFLVPVNKGSGLRPDYIAFAGYQVTF
jgi:Putative MetA-pathway of phenol degradation